MLNCKRTRRLGTRALGVLATSVMLLPCSSFAESRLALVIGNGDYSSIGALPNPTSDAELIAGSLESVGFKTTVLLDADQYAMKKGIAEFGRSLRKSSKEAVGLFYYAGHGVQAQGKNFLLPVEAEPVDAADLDLMGVEADWVLRQMESAGNRSNIMILDACRNNPFVASNRSLGRGLAQIDAPTGSFISYATAPGKVALDGDKENSPFTKALADALPTPGLALEQIFKKVRIDVLNATEGRQIPWDSSSLVEDLILAAPVDSEEFDSQEEMANKILTAEVAIPNEVVEKPLSESELVSRAQRTRNIDDYRNYLKLFPEGAFSEFFRAEIEYLQSSSVGDSETRLSEAGVSEPLQIESENGVQATGGSSLESQIAKIEVYDFLTRSLIVDGSEQLRSIQELSQGSPLYPPFEGLPDKMWKGQDCSNCHGWEKANLCEQGSFYAGKDDDALSRHKHPYGGSFKATLKQWAERGCL